MVIKARKEGAGAQKIKKSIDMWSVVWYYNSESRARKEGAGAKKIKNVLTGGLWCGIIVVGIGRGLRYK